MSFRTVRKHYFKHTLEEENCPDDPTTMLHGWLEEALQHGEDANAMTLSTVSAGEAPSSRIVLVRSLDPRGLSFFTNYKSRKGQEMEVNSKVALNFFWPWLERQVRVEGSVEKLPAPESDEYFAGRPRESQLGAWVSDQSDVLATRAELDQRLLKLAAEFENKEIPRPAHWGGYLVRPVYFEFWQGRPNRLHDRIAYERSEDGSWKRYRLFP